MIVLNDKLAQICQEEKITLIEMIDLLGTHYNLP